jgi:hypothetical protein
LCIALSTRFLKWSPLIDRKKLQCSWLDRIRKSVLLYSKQKLVLLLINLRKGGCILHAYIWYNITYIVLKLLVCCEWQVANQWQCKSQVPFLVGLIVIFDQWFTFQGFESFIFPLMDGFGSFMYLSKSALWCVSVKTKRNISRAYWSLKGKVGYFGKSTYYYKYLLNKPLICQFFPSL